MSVHLLQQVQQQVLVVQAAAAGSQQQVHLPAGPSNIGTSSNEGNGSRVEAAYEGVRA
jgi:hypothetical protein